MNIYDQMKDSGYPWMGEIPSHWRDINPKALFIQRKERAKEDDRQLTASQQYGVLYQDEYMALTGSRVVVVQKDFDILKHVEAGDFVISMRSFQGGLEYSPVSGSISSAYVMLIPNKELVYPPFYRWLLKSSAYIRALQSTSDLVRDGQAMRYSNFAKVRLLLVPMDEQKAIASYLDEKVSQIDSIIKEANASIEKYKQWKAAIIYEAVTKGLNKTAGTRESGIDILGVIPRDWGLKRLKFLCDITTGNQDTQDAVADGIYPFYVRSPIVERSNKYTFDGESILMAGDGAGAGRIFHHAFGKYAIHQRVYCLHHFTDIKPRFLYYFLSSRFSIEMDKGSAKSTVPSVRLPMLQNFRVCIPPYKEQDDIINYLDNKNTEIDAVIMSKEETVKKLERYKRSLIYEAVTGKRKVV